MAPPSKLVHHPSAPTAGESHYTSDHEDLPHGKLRMVITYLEMNKPPKFKESRTRSDGISIIRARKPTLSFYRYLYNAVGSAWCWYERNLLSDKELAAIIHHPDVHLYVLYVQGTPAGFVELDFQNGSEPQIAYFGFVPEFIGRGLGKYFMMWSVEKAWTKDTNRLWVHTCNLDHPKAISTYQQAGFSPYKQTIQIIDDPRVKDQIQED